MKDRTTRVDKPPMKVSEEAEEKTLKLAKQQGDAYHKAVEYMAKEEAHGEMKPAGNFIVAYAWEDAEGMFMQSDGQLEWKEPKGKNIHIEVAVMDGADHRFVPGLTVTVTLIDQQGKEIGTHKQPFIWHPWLYHYGRNWKIPGEGEYTIRIHIDAAKFMRHDPKNGKRYAQPIEVEFQKVHLKPGVKHSKPS